MVDAFELAVTDIVAFVGGGGKSSLMFGLAEEWPGTVITTTTTRLFRDQLLNAPSVCSLEDNRDEGIQRLNELEEQVKRHRHCLVIGRVEGDKALGVPAALPMSLAASAYADLILVEADGSRMLPCKAPAEHEPVIPQGTTLVIPMVGIDACGRNPNTAAHRPERVKVITGLKEGDLITPADLATIITHEEGGLKNVPEDARVIPFINKVDSAKRLSLARITARLILKSERVSHVVIGALHQPKRVKEIHRRVAGIILAAGRSERMGTMKLQLPWGRSTILGQSIANVKSSAINDIIVVAGHQPDLIKGIADSEGVPVIYNPDYMEGEMLSTLQAGIKSLAENQAAILVYLADQPMVTHDIIDKLLHYYWQGNAGLIAPVYRGQRGNPVLFSRRYFKDLLELTPGMAPRNILERYTNDLHLVEVETPAVVHDIDSPQDFRRWQPRA